MDTHVKRAKTSRERKAEFDKRMKNRGGADKDRPERWAMAFYLTQQSLDEVKRIRDEARFEGTQPSRNAALFEDMLQVYLAWRRGELAPTREAEALTAPSRDAEPSGRLSKELENFRRSIVLLSTTMLRAEAYGDSLLDAHASERWGAFTRLIDHLRRTDKAPAPTIEVAHAWQREFEDYLKLLIHRVEDSAVAQVEVPPKRSRLFSRVLQRLMR